jgi:two-component system, sensor histidine kinase and response regulator
MTEAEKRQSILIVDDEPNNVKVMREVLTNGYDIFVALNGLDALQVAGKSLPDLILLDIMMPEMDGYEVCRRLKADPATRDIPVIFVTAMDQEEDEARGLTLGAIDYLTKPINPPIVRIRVKNHLELKLARERLKRQNEELVEAAALKEDVERISRHDLKSPLTGIIGLPRVMLDEGGLTEEQEIFLKMIEESGYKMLNMINLSLDLFKMERGTYEYSPTTVDLAGIARKVLTESIIQVEDKELSVELLANGRPLEEGQAFMGRGEPLLCYSMLANLLHNALEAAPEGSMVRVAIDGGGSRDVRIVIHNQGAAPESVRDKIFEKYATSGKTRGTGLGAYSARLIAETHGGAISMTTSEADGTTVTVSLPG